jgi:hypothetical protein
VPDHPLLDYGEWRRRIISRAAHFQRERTRNPMGLDEAIAVALEVVPNPAGHRLDEPLTQADLDAAPRMRVRCLNPVLDAK